MVELIITDRLHMGVMMKGRNLQLITMRKLSGREVALAKKMGMRRYYLPNLTDKEGEKFLEEYSKFWDQIIEPFHSDHPFWRNPVSSKMQEWEESSAYLALILFTITQTSQNTSPCIVIVCASIEEEEICESWGRMYDWTVHRKPFLSLPIVLRKLHQLTKNSVSFSLRVAHFLYQRFLLRSQNIASTNSTVLIASAFYPSAFQNGAYVDAFFGQIDQYLLANGKKCDYLCMPLGRIGSNLRTSIDAQGETNVYIPLTLLGWSELLVLFVKVFFRRIIVPEGQFMGCNFANLLTWNAHRFSHSFTLISELYFAAVARLSRTQRYRQLLVNFEGNAFERGCIQAFRKSGKGHITGYCQGVIFPLNLKLSMTSNEKINKPEPDAYICTGPHSKYLLEKYGGRSPSDVFSGCSLREIPKLSKRTLPSHSNNTVLVSLDGVGSSVIVLEWLMENASHLREYHFLIRAHPNVPLQHLLKQCLGSWPDNFEPSTGSLEVDLQKCFCVLYRQTSIGLQALLNDIPTIHLNIDMPLPGDPMVGVEASWLAVNNCEGLIEAFKQIKGHGAPSQNSRHQRGIVEKYFSLPTQDNMKVFLN